MERLLHRREQVDEQQQQQKPDQNNPNQNTPIQNIPCPPGETPTSNKDRPLPKGGMKSQREKLPPYRGGGVGANGDSSGNGSGNGNSGPKTGSGSPIGADIPSIGTDIPSTTQLETSTSSTPTATNTDVGGAPIVGVVSASTALGTPAIAAIASSLGALFLLLLLFFFIRNRRNKVKRSPPPVRTNDMTFNDIRRTNSTTSLFNRPDNFQNNNDARSSPPASVAILPFFEKTAPLKDSFASSSRSGRDFRNIVSMSPKNVVHEGEVNIFEDDYDGGVVPQRMTVLSEISTVTSDNNNKSSKSAGESVGVFQYDESLMTAAQLSLYSNVQSTEKNIFSLYQTTEKDNSSLYSNQQSERKKYSESKQSSVITSKYQHSDRNRDSRDNRDSRNSSQLDEEIELRSKLSPTLSEDDSSVTKLNTKINSVTVNQLSQDRIRLYEQGKIDFNQLTSLEKKEVGKLKEAQINAFSGYRNSSIDMEGFVPPAPTSHVTLRSYFPQLDDEMRIDAGDLIGVEKEYEDGWARGQNISQNRRRGFFPLVILKPIKSGPSQKVFKSTFMPKNRRLTGSSSKNSLEEDGFLDLGERVESLARNRPPSL